MGHKTAQEGSGKLAGKKGFCGKEKQMREDNGNQSTLYIYETVKEQMF